MQTEIAKGAARVTSLGLDIDVVDGFGAFVRGSTGKTYLVHRLPDGRLTCTCPDAVFGRWPRVQACPQATWRVVGPPRPLTDITGRSATAPARFRA